jgi:SAM-dependent methyltransferase
MIVIGLKRSMKAFLRSSSLYHTSENDMAFFNSYDDETRAEAYARLGFDNTYYLAFRDIPSLISKHVTGMNALDFGCGTGRSTRFLVNLGFNTDGVDTSREMIAKAKSLDPAGIYHWMANGDFTCLEKKIYDLILSAFTFDNIPHGTKARLFAGLSARLADKGVLINLVSSPEIYIHEWASFTTKDYPENKKADSGGIVRIVTKDFGDSRPCDDILCTEKDYRAFYAQAHLRVLTMLQPLAYDNEPYHWVSETRIAPWSIYLLGKDTS